MARTDRRAFRFVSALMLELACMAFSSARRRFFLPASTPGADFKYFDLRLVVARFGRALRVDRLRERATWNAVGGGGKGRSYVAAWSP